MRKLRIAVDVDDCILEYVASLTQFYNKVHDDKITINDIKAWDLKTAYEKTNTQDSVKALMDHFIQHKMFEEMPPVPDAIEGIQALGNSGHEIYFISARGSKAIDACYKWFNAHNLPLKNIYFNREKWWLVDKLGIDVMIDDGIHNLDLIQEEYIKLRRDKYIDTIVFDRPWNRQPPNYLHKRARNWDEVLAIIKELE